MAGTYSHLAEMIRGNRPVALATVIAGAQTGSKILVPAEGAVPFTDRPVVVALEDLAHLALGGERHERGRLQDAPIAGNAYPS